MKRGIFDLSRKVDLFEVHGRGHVRNQTGFLAEERRATCLVSVDRIIGTLRKRFTSSNALVSRRAVPH